MKTIISAKWPPTDDCNITETYEHRNGRRVKYSHGKNAGTEAERRIEMSAIIGENWCHWCSGLVWWSRNDSSGFNGSAHGTTHPRFFRHQGWQCPDCARRISETDVREAQIEKIKQEIEALEKWEKRA